jgi:hypothetical protein
MAKQSLRLPEHPRCSSASGPTCNCGSSSVGR